jgi:hypothetical protein
VGQLSTGVDKVAAMTFPPERILAMRSALVVFEKQVRTQGNSDAVALRQAALKLFRTAQGLARPVSIPSPADQVRALFGDLQTAGWASATIELLVQDLKPGEQIKSLDAVCVTTNFRSIGKRELIDRYRPHAMTDNHLESWRRMHTRPDFIMREPQG